MRWGGDGLYHVPNIFKYNHDTGNSFRHYSRQSKERDIYEEGDDNMAFCAFSQGSIK